MQAAPFLDKVKEIVSGPREKEYGDKSRNISAPMMWR